MVKISRYSIFFMALLGFQCAVYANYDIIVENNTPHTLVIDTENDTRLPSAAHSGWHNRVLKPYQRAKVQTFSYFEHLKYGQSYRFRVNAYVLKGDTTEAVPTLIFDSVIRGDLTGSHITKAAIGTRNASHALFTTKPHPSYAEVKSTQLQDVFSAGDIINAHATAVKYTYPNPHANFQSTDMLMYSITVPEATYQRSNDSNTLTTLTYNVQLWPFYGRAGGIIMNHPAARAVDIPKQIGSYDVVAIEELMDATHRQTLSEHMYENYPYQVGPPDAHKPLSGGVKLFSHWPIETSETYVYKHCYDIDCAAAKGAVYAKLVKYGKPYHVFATHFQAATEDKPSDDTRLNARQQQIIELMEFIAAQNIPHDEPVLLLGDLNVNALACFQKDVADCREYQFFISRTKGLYFPQDNHSILPYTADGLRDWMDSSPNDAKILDYILPLNPYLSPVEYHSRVRAFRDDNDPQMYTGKPYGDTDLSDHFALEARISYPK